MSTEDSLMRNMNMVLIFLTILTVLSACGGQEPIQTPDRQINLITYSSETLGIISVIPNDWVAFWPSGMFVRDMPQIDPTFLMFGVIPGTTPDQLLSAFASSTGTQETPAIIGNRNTDKMKWTLYSFEIQQGVLLTYYPDYGTQVLDIALAESNGNVIAVSIGSALDERDWLYERVFLPAVDALMFNTDLEPSVAEGIDLHKRDYWPTEGWKTSTPEVQNLDGHRLEEMVDFIRYNNIPINRAIVVRHGYIILDEQFSSNQTIQNLKSITKSFTSALVGIVVDRGYIDSVDQTVLSFFPSKDIVNIDARKDSMTVEDLLTMRSGLDWPPGPCWWVNGDECADYTTQIMLESNDSLQFILDQPIINEPGTTFSYNAGASHLLSTIITETTGMSAFDFANEYLFDPLGIHNVRWAEDGEGLNMGWTDISLDPYDMAKFGFLYLNEGQWDGEQIISAGWVRESSKPHTLTSNQHIQPYYGYQWWVNPDLDFYNAAGAGGNYIIVVPEKDMVVVFTGNNTGSLGRDKWWEGTPEELFRVYILPSID
jgi:CubicO group peptidase (beta-lactamase class C family)